jgi:hypothetical protein
MARKTVSVDYMKDTINKRLATSYTNSDTREGMISALVEILHSTGNYNGFRYLTESEVPLGARPGIRWVDGVPDFTNTDRTRVCYH